MVYGEISISNPELVLDFFCYSALILFDISIRVWQETAFEVRYILNADFWTALQFSDGAIVAVSALVSILQEPPLCFTSNKLLFE